MSLQFVTNSKGEKTSVIVSYKEWNKFQQEHEELKHKLQEAELQLRFKNSLNDARLFEKGSLKTYPISELLNEL